MAEPAPCSLCRHTNPPGNRFCGSCGAPLTGGEQLATRQDHNPVPARRAWPAKLGPAGRALAVGVAVLAAEVGVSWLRRKIGAGVRSSMPAVRSTGSTLHGYLLSQSLEEVLIQTEDSPNRVLARREDRSFVTAGSTDRRRSNTSFLPLDRPITTEAGGYATVRRCQRVRPRRGHAPPWRQGADLWSAQESHRAGHLGRRS